MKAVLSSCRLAQVASRSPVLLPGFGEAVRKLVEELLKKETLKETPLTFEPSASVDFATFLQRIRCALASV
jgi:hypothetical protein